MTASISFPDSGYSDRNRDATAALEGELRDVYGTDKIVCTYSGANRRVTIWFGDELDPVKREAVLDIRYALKECLDVTEISEALAEAAGALARRR